MASVVSTLYYSNTVDIRPTLRMRISTQLVSHSFCTSMKQYIRSGGLGPAPPVRIWVRIRDKRNVNVGPIAVQV